MNLLGRLLGKPPPPQQSLAERTKNQHRAGTVALFRDITLYVEQTYNYDRDDASAIAGAVCNLICGQPIQPGALENLTPDQSAIAEVLAQSLPQNDDGIRIRAAYLCMTWGTHLQELATQSPDNPANEQILRDSIDAFLRPFSYGAGNGNLLALVAKSYSFLNEYEPALKYALDAVAASPEEFNPHLTLGIIAFQIERLDIAEPALRKAIALEPSLVGVREMLAEIDLSKST